MHIHSTCLLLLLFPLTACSSQGAAPRNPGSPTPVAGPDPAAAAPEGRPGERGPDGPDWQRVPVRPDQAPLVGIREALDADSLLGRRVRIAGRCTAAGQGRRAGSWTLTSSDAAIEVRGRVPPSCSAGEGHDLIIFAQVERKTTGTPDRVLLRLPD